jgi:hypothetical protein
VSDLDHQRSAGTGQQAAGAGTKELSIEQHSIDYVPWSERRGKLWHRAARPQQLPEQLQRLRAADAVLLEGPEAEWD